MSLPRPIKLLNPRRGEIWDAILPSPSYPAATNADQPIMPVEGHEQGGRRPVLVISDDRLNAGRSERIIVLCLTTSIRSIKSHIVIEPPEGGVNYPSAIICDDIRSISRNNRRLVRKRGNVSQTTLDKVAAILLAILDLSTEKS